MIIPPRKDALTPDMMMGRLFNISENIPILKMNREHGYWDGPEALNFHLGNNYIYIGPELSRLKLPASPLACNGKTPEQYRRWLWGRICAKDSAILDELSKVTLVTSIAHWPEDAAIAAIVQKAANWLWSQKPEPAVPSDLDTTGEFGQSQLGWDGYAAKHEVLYSPHRTSSLFDNYDEAWEHFVSLPPAIHIEVVRRLAHTQAKAMTVNDWNDERRQNALMCIAKGTIEGGETSLYVLFPNHGWCVGASDPERLLERILRSFSGRRTFE